MTATDGQKVAAKRLLGSIAGDWILSELVGEEIEQMSRDGWTRLREMAYPDWRDDDWTIGQDFAAKLATLRSRHEVEVNGQGDMFA